MATQPPPSGNTRSVRPAQAFVDEHYSRIAQIVSIVCARYRCFGEDAEDFRQEVFIKLLEGRALASFRRECRIETFLSVVITNLFRDFRMAQWGKWRPSARAAGMGPTAVRLETLMVRDGLLLEEAVETLSSDPSVSDGPDQLRELAAKLPPRFVRRTVADSDLSGVPAASSADDSVIEGERTRRRARIVAALNATLDELSGEERLLLKLRFDEGCPVAQLARSLGTPQRKLYARFDSLQRSMREAMRRNGISEDEVCEGLRNWDVGDEGEDHDAF